MTWLMLVLVGHLFVICTPHGSQGLSAGMKQNEGLGSQDQANTDGSRGLMDEKLAGLVHL